jgi:hypothetical protein
MQVLAKVLSVAFVLFLIGLYEWPKINSGLRKERIVFIILCALTLLVSVYVLQSPYRNTPVELLLSSLKSTLRTR